MSGIFKGDSIYKSGGGGGGGGGYNDGGQLIDGDFIKVENNSVSSYENLNRNEINFYFEKKQSEILNSVIELTTQVNATVNVYYLNENNIFVLLGYIGNNTVNAGDEYNINITGNGYEIEPVTPPAPDPQEIIMLAYDKTLKFKKFGSTYWQTDNFNGIIPGVDYVAKTNAIYYKISDIINVSSFENGLRLPNDTDIFNLCTNLGFTMNDVSPALKSTNQGWYNNEPLYVGTNSSGLNYQGYGGVDENKQIFSYGDYGFWHKKNEGDNNCFSLDDYTPKLNRGYIQTGRYIMLRFVYDA
jgi:hypothetical protein